MKKFSIFLRPIFFEATWVFGEMWNSVQIDFDTKIV